MLSGTSAWRCNSSRSSPARHNRTRWRHSRAITFVSAAILFFFGIVLLTDNLSQITAKLTNLWNDLGLDGLVNR